MPDPSVPTPAPSVSPTIVEPTPAPSVTPTPVPTVSPTTHAPTTAKPTTAAPTTAQPTMAPHWHHHFSKMQEIEIDSSVVIGFVLVCVLAILYKKRRKLPLYCMRLKYYLCCCRLSPQELVQQQEEHETLNDFLFEVDNNEQVGRVNVSGLTTDYDDDDDVESRVPVKEVSIQSLFPDILGQEMEQNQQSTSSFMREPLLSQNNR